MQPQSPPPHQHPSGVADSASGRWPTQAPALHGYQLGGVGDTIPKQQLSVTDLFIEALDGALQLVRADGGELATLDDTRQTMALRARRSRPRIDGGFGSPSRASQPIPPLAPGASFGSRAFTGGIGSITDETAGLDEIEGQSTQLLPATLSTRKFRPGERLIGHVWQRGEAVIMRGEDCRSLPGGTAPHDHTAAWHLAVPIPLPRSLATVRAKNEIIGVISVYNRDPLWSFTPADMELLTLHADRVGRALQIAELSSLSQSQSDLLNVLGADATDVEERLLYARLRDVVRRVIDAPAFAVVLYQPRQDEVTFALAERDGHMLPETRISANSLPPWWAAIRDGHTLCISAPEDRALRPEYCRLGWGSDTPVPSILAAPLIMNNTLLGAIVAGSPRPDVYAPEHARLFASIARSGAIVLHKSQLTEETRVSLARAHEKERQLSILNNAVLTLNASLNLDETLRSIVTQAVHLTEAQVCAVFLLDEDKDKEKGEPEHVTLRAIQSLLSGDIISAGDAHIPLNWRGLKDLIKSGQFMLMDHLETEWDDTTSVGRWLEQQRIRSCLMAPLAQQDTEIGVLLVYTPDQRHHFPSGEIVLLQGLASQAAAAINNARLYERLQRAYEKQKYLDKLKDDFILTVSHEFRTPVTAIDGYVTLISRHGHKLEQAKLEQFADEIRQATSQLMGMINRLHDANSADEHPLVLSTRPVNILAVAKQAIATMAPEAKARIQCDIGDDLWAVAEPDRLTHVFSNLIGNAIKYAPGDSPCQLTARIENRAALAAAGRPHAQAENAAQRWVVVGVRDFGDGIAPADQAKLFQKFVRLTRSLTTSVRGTGLGLWICQQYLEAMGGDIWVESEFGSGAHFFFSLPWEPVPEQAHS